MNEKIISSLPGQDSWPTVWEATMYALLAALGTYTLTSLFLFRYPHVLHKPKNVRKCKHISHRGGAGENYENTMAAFSHAVRLGTDMLELDCHLTKDRHVVVAHDTNLMRTCSVNKSIKELEYQELPLMETRIPIDFEPGKWYMGREQETLRRIPLLSEVFKAFPEVSINIDLKEGADGLVEEVNRLIVAHQREDRTVWGSFKQDVSMRCYNENPSVGLFFSLNGVLKLCLLFYSGLLPFVPLKETHLEIPAMHLKYIEHLPWTRRLVMRAASALILRPALIRHLYKRGIPTYAWVLNSESDFERVFKLGVTGIMTDYPTKLRHFIDSKSP